MKSNNSKIHIWFSALAVLLAMLLTVAATLAWFTISGGNEKTTAFSVGKVEYTAGDANEIFYKAFELEEEDYVEDDFNEDDGYIPAVSIASVMANSQTLNQNQEMFYLNMTRGSKQRVTLGFSPENATDKLSFSSSNASAISVSLYGMLYAIGDPGESSVITVTATDRDMSAQRRQTDLTARITVVITEGDSDNEYGYLPGEVNILRQPFAAVNKSTVDTKTRIRVEWNYSEYTADDELDNEYKKYDFLTLFPTGVVPANITVKSSVLAPASVSLGESWRFLPSEGALTLNDINGRSWTVDVLSLRDSDIVSLEDAITNGTAFAFNEKMIDKAHLYICYSSTEILSLDGDYGDVVPAVANVSAPVPYEALTAFTTNSTYAGFSTRKVFSVTFVIEARQAKAYDEDDWYDVYCLKEDFSAAEHGVTGA